MPTRTRTKTTRTGKPYIDLFQGGDGDWYFNRVARNGEVTVSSEGYSAKSSAKRAARKLWPTLEIRDRSQGSQ